MENSLPELSLQSDSGRRTGFSLNGLAAALRQEGGELFGAGGEVSAAWFQALAQSTLDAGETAQLAVLRGKNGGGAALALARRADGTLRALTAPYTTRFAVLADEPKSARSLGAALGTTVARRLELDALEDTPINRALLEGLKSVGMICASYRHFANWHDEVASFADYWAARPASLRHTVTRKGEKARKAGAQFELAASPQEIGALLPLYLEVYAQSGKVPEPHAAFMPAMVEALAARGEVRLGLLRLEGAPVAAQIWLVDNERATIFKLAHRREWPAFSPGTLLTHWMLSQLLARDRIRRVDFGRGDDAYKRNWLTRRCFRWGVIACNPRNPAGLRDIAAQILPTWAGGWLRRMAPAPPAHASCISTAASRPILPETESITNN